MFDVFTTDIPQKCSDITIELTESLISNSEPDFATLVERNDTLAIQMSLDPRKETFYLKGYSRASWSFVMIPVNITICGNERVSVPTLPTQIFTFNSWQVNEQSLPADLVRSYHISSDNECPLKTLNVSRDTQGNQLDASTGLGIIYQEDPQAEIGSQLIKVLPWLVTQNMTF